MKSYHLLHGAISRESDREREVLAHSIQTAARGLVPHAEYLTAAERTERLGGENRVFERLQHGVEWDANPVAELLSDALDRHDLTRRWQDLHAVMPLGVATHIECDGERMSVRRRPLTSEPDSSLRSSLIEVCVDLLLARLDRGAKDDRPDRLLSIARRMGLSGDAMTDVLHACYENPSQEIGAFAAAHGCSPRTLQRALSHHGLTFSQVRLAARVNIAAFRMRKLNEPLTRTAQEAGFYDSAHLSHAWQAACGMSPRAYRAIARG